MQRYYHQNHHYKTQLSQLMSLGKVLRSCIKLETLFRPPFWIISLLSRYHDLKPYLKVKCDTYSSLASFYGDYQNNSKRLCWPIVERIKNNGGNKQNKKKTHAFMGKGGTCSGNAWKKSDEWERLIFEREKI